MATPSRSRLTGALSVLTIGTMLFLPFCGPASPTDQPAGGGSPAGDDGPAQTGDAEIESGIMHATDLDAWFDAVAKRPESYVAPHTPTSAELIQLAYELGGMTEEEYYILRITDIFDHENLDQAYRGEPVPLRSATSILRELSRRIDGFSVSAQGQLRPYMAHFDDPQSFWYRPNDVVYPTASETGKVNDTVRHMDRPTAGGDFFEISGEPGQDVAVTVVREALSTAYDAFVGLGFTEPTDWIEVKVRADFGSSDLYGEQTFHVSEGHRRCQLVILSDQPDDDLRGTVAHELFHCFQEYVDADPPVAHDAWVSDSSAVWAEEFAFPEGNSEHLYDRTFFSTLEIYLFDTEDTNEYASYPFWFFIYQRDGKTGNAVHDLYMDIQENGLVEAISARPDFYQEYKDYALWNLNSDPHQYYEDFDDAFSLRPFGGSIQNRRLRTGRVVTDPVILQSGAILYYVYRIDDDVDKVSFDLTEVQKDEDNENGIQAVYRIDGEWNYEDVSYRDELVFCRKRNSEKVDGVILIVSNGKMDESDRGSIISGDLTVDTTESCTPVWHGYVECSWDDRGPGDGRGDDLLDPGDFTSLGTTRVDESLVLEPGWAFFYTDATVSIHSRYEWYWKHVLPDTWEVTGYTDWERRVEEKNATKSFVNDVGPNCPPDCSGPRRILIQTEGGVTRYTLNDLSFLDMGQYQSVYSAYYVPGSLGIMQGHVAEVRTSVDEHTINVSCPPDSFELTMSADGKALSGTYQSGSLSCEASYRFD